jgi:hypothetical protein
MQTGSSETLIGLKSGKTTYVPLWDRMEGAWLWTLKNSTCYELLWSNFVSMFIGDTPPPHVVSFSLIVMYRSKYLAIARVPNGKEQNAGDDLLNFPRN